SSIRIPNMVGVVSRIQGPSSINTIKVYNRPQIIIQNEVHVQTASNTKQISLSFQGPHRVYSDLQAGRLEQMLISAELRFPLCLWVLPVLPPLKFQVKSTPLIYGEQLLSNIIVE